jgi:hypothetical protein
VIGYIKDKGINLGAMITSLKFIVSCENFWLEELFESTFLGIPCRRPTNMVQSMKRFWLACMTFISNLLKQTFKNAWHGFKIWDKDAKNGQVCVLMCGSTSMKTKHFLWKQGEILHFTKFYEFCLHESNICYYFVSCNL